MTQLPATAPGRVRRLSQAIAVTAVALLLAAGYVAGHAVPSTEAVRIRNSMIAVAGTEADLDWRPPAVPRGFLQQAGPAPTLFVEAAARAGTGPALERALALVRELDSGPEHGGPIQRSTLDTYRKIRAEGQGYCADYTQVLNGLAWAAGIPVREWGMSFDGFGGWGHAFNEVFDAGLGKWVMIDPFYGFWVRDRDSGQPLSAIEFRDRLRAARPLDHMEVMRLSAAAYDWTSDEKMLAFYRRGIDQFYLWWGNNVFDYDNEPLVRAVSPLSRSLEQAVAIAVGVHPGIRILLTPANGQMVSDLRRTRDRVGTALLACLALSMLLAALWHLRSRARRAGSGA